MQDILAESLKKLKRKRARRLRLISILLVLSLVVSLDVFWNLRQPGWTLAGDADCGIIEHTHDKTCQNGETPCPLTEHTHTLSCYSDDKADVESQIDWQKMFEDYPFTGNLAEDLVGIAKTQVGYNESSSNFEVDADGIRRGYTRYGAWYGTPYGNWSATFVSFCLHYAGADANEYPINTGANSMAELWKALGKYAAADEYKPYSGDLVFFTDNTVGIVSEVYSTTISVIRGDIENSVQTSIISLTDDLISGYGIVNNRISNQELYDISNGPAFFVFAGGSTKSQVRRYSLRTMPVNEKIENMVDYLNEKEGHYFLSLMDLNNFEISKDADGNYIAHAGTTYKLAMSFSSPNGFEPGTYTYQLPQVLTIHGGDDGKLSGEFKLGEGDNKIVVGTWSVSTDGLITIIFNDNMNDRSEVTISATMGVEFPVYDEPIDFDGKITVSIEKPRDEIFETEVKKWGVQGNEENGKNTAKINWTVQIEGNENSNIPGSLLTDQILKHDWSYEHYYDAETDIANGLHFGLSVNDPDHGEVYWHKWTVKLGDPNLINWDANGWSYQIPETIRCEICGNTVELGNDYRTYYIEYTSTPVSVNVAGELGYSNLIEVDNQQAEGWGGFTQTKVEAAIFKNGTLTSDANGGKVVWEILATIPGRKPDEKAECEWLVGDNMAITDQWGVGKDYVKNNIHLASVTANYYGTTINIPTIQNATENDPYAVDSWDPWLEGFLECNGIPILCRCTCTEDTCPKWNSETGCNKWVYYDENQVGHKTDFCDCWLETEDTTLTFTYEADVTDAIKNHNGSGYVVLNSASLSNGYPENDKTKDYVGTYATVPLPNMVNKEIEQDFSVVNKQIAKYQIMVNEAKLQLTDGSPLIITDEMTKTLSFIRGSLVITTEDADGNINTLQEGIDYSYEFYVPDDHDTHDGTHTGEQHVHVLEIEILHPQPVKYILDYDAAIVIPEGTIINTSVKYKNSVSVELWKKKITDTTGEKIFPDINISSSTYGIKVIKKSAEDGKILPNAKFGIFNENEHLITEGYTNENGEIVFKTNVANGIVFREHVLYYVKELEAPPGYKLDDTKYWFCFCNTPDDSCTVFKEVVAETNAFRVPYNTIGEITVTNELLIYDLPSTGGPGIYVWILVSVIFIVIPLIYMFIRRRKRERRGVG